MHDVEAPLRVLQLICTNGLYGAERWILALVNGFDPDRVVCDLAVTIESATQDMQLAERYPADVGEVLPLPMAGAFDPRVVTRLARLLRARRIDVVHTHGYKSYLIGWAAARLAKVAVVATPHGFGTVRDLRSRLYTAAGNLALRRHDAIAPLSVALEQEVRRYGVPEARTTLIPNAVDLDEVHAALAAPSGPLPELPPGRVVGYVGQLIARKRIDLMIEAFAELWTREPDAHLVVVGDGDSRAALQAMASRLPCGSHIHWLGFRDDRLAVLKRLEVFVMTSESEGIPRCLMEAMAAGVPIVAFDTPGVDVLVEDGVTGALVTHGDTAELARRIRELLDTPGRAERLVVAARERVETAHSARRMAREYDELFRTVLAKDIERCGGGG